MEIKIMLAAAVFFGGWLLSYVFLRQLLFNFRVAYPLLNKMKGIDPELIAPGARRYTNTSVVVCIVGIAVSAVWSFSYARNTSSSRSSSVLLSVW